MYASTSSSCITSSTGPFISAVAGLGKLQKIMGMLEYFRMEENAGKIQLGVGFFEIGWQEKQPDFLVLIGTFNERVSLH